MNIFRREKVKENGLEAKINLQLMESYSNLIGTMAWKDLEVFMMEIFSQSVKDEDLIPIMQYDIAAAAEARGLRKAIDKIRKHVGYYVQREGG